MSARSLKGISNPKTANRLDPRLCSPFTEAEALRLAEFIFAHGRELGLWPRVRSERFNSSEFKLSSAV